MELIIDLTGKAKGYKEAFTELVTSPFAAEGNLRCELGPIPYTGLTKGQLKARCTYIDHKRVCAKFTKFDIDGDIVKVEVTPSGPLKAHLEQLLTQGIEFEPVARAAFNRDMEIIHMFNIDLNPV
ncbi:hypothetical protein PHABIO_341 [Pseudomonas phage Phabio]|uniref:Uncharacterized protein n=1 Tax=Pseudomonas phage Phabio TaxID=2006668 RepID=A0A1Y0SU01_9CAUD|nr:hypothetical protein MZD05_gp341 [Pseudomonas phage Phabio]ARV76972.1 hypothetical protein PHABIO_341 [Pseudomonas phage Phabio]